MIELRTIPVLALTAALVTLAAGCTSAPEPSAAPGSPSASSTGAPVRSTADRCRQAVKALNAYSKVAAKHPIVLTPGYPNPPETIDPVKEAAATAAADLRAAADGLTATSVAEQLHTSVEILDQNAAGKFGFDQATLPIPDLIEACGAAAPELAKDESFHIDLDFGS